MSLAYITEVQNPILPRRQLTSPVTGATRFKRSRQIKRSPLCFHLKKKRDPVFETLLHSQGDGQCPDTVTLNFDHVHGVCNNSCFFHNTNYEIIAVTTCYATQSGRYLQTFGTVYRSHLQRRRVFLDYLTHEYGTDRLSRNVGSPKSHVYKLSSFYKFLFMFWHFMRSPVFTVYAD
jgi:hypothetical protein